MNNKKLLAVLFVLGLSSASCGKIIDAAANRAVEEGIEQAIESDTGENVDLDLNLDDGKITITGEDGEEVRIDANGEDGTINITGTDGEGNKENVEITGDDDGVNIESDSGSMTFGEGLPEDWPSEWSLPPDVNVVQGSKFVEGARTSFTTTFEANGDFDRIVDFYTNLSVSDDVTATSQTSSDGYTSFYQAWGNDEEGETSFITVTESDGSVTGTLFVSVDSE